MAKHELRGFVEMLRESQLLLIPGSFWGELDLEEIPKHLIPTAIQF